MKTSEGNRLIYISGAALCLLLMICILLFFPKTGWIRGTAGDFIVVVFLYFSLGGSFLLSPIRSALISLAVSFGIEGLQYLRILDLLHLSDFKAARIIFGSVYDPMDLIAYAAGAGAAFFSDTGFLSFCSPEQ